MTAFEIPTSDGALISGNRIGASDKPVLLFSHSLGCTSDMWTHQASDLSDRLSIVLYDTRGHGRSEVVSGAYSMSRLGLDVIEIMDALKIDRAHFCGLSLGGMIGQYLAAHASDRFESFVLAATSGYMGPPSGWQSRINLVLESGLASIAEASAGKWFAPQGFASSESKQQAEEWLLNTDPVGYAGCCGAIRDMDLRDIAGVGRRPTLVLAGADDQATPVSHSELMMANRQNARLAVLPGAHLLNLEQPAMFTHEMIKFYDTLPLN